jgi:hypothetical protein
MVGRDLVCILGVGGLEVLYRPKRIRNLCSVSAQGSITIAFYED